MTMIISENRKPELRDFQILMSNTDCVLNLDARQREKYYLKRGGKLLENDVFEAISECAKGTPFENTIQLVSGASFPDIVANNYYGVEVKSTEKNHWTSIGSSILESTRNQNVERIYLTFGKLGEPVEFLSRPYEECLSGIAVTHYPRYQIDMRLEKGQTIFDKMGISYDELRLMDNPVAPVSKYYKSKLKPGESLWWATDNVEAAAPATVRLWTALSPEEQTKYAAYGYVLFPEIFSPGSKKYSRYALWLATHNGIVMTNIRDVFSAGGQKVMLDRHRNEVKLPAVFGRIIRYKDYILQYLYSVDEELLREYWGVPEVSDNRIGQWCELVALAADRSVGYSLAKSIIESAFLL